MKILGLITARGGSKGIPRKNLALLAGRPLLAYTCEVALGCRSLDRVVLSTDDEEIAAVGRGFGVELPFFRPKEFAGDQSGVVDVVLHAAEWLERHEDWRPDVVAVLQPTSPLRTSRHIDEAVSMLQGTGADTVVSVVKVPHRFVPQKTLRLEEGRLVSALGVAGQGAPLRRQDLPTLYARNGPAVLVVRLESVLRDRGFYGGAVVPIEMGQIESIDIDDPEDLFLAEAVLAFGHLGLPMPIDLEME